MKRITTLFLILSMILFGMTAIGENGALTQTLGEFQYEILPGYTDILTEENLVYYYYGSSFLMCMVFDVGDMSASLENSDFLVEYSFRTVIESMLSTLGMEDTDSYEAEMTTINGRKAMIAETSFFGLPLPLILCLGSSEVFFAGYIKLGANAPEADSVMSLIRSALCLSGSVSEPAYTSQPDIDFETAEAYEKALNQGEDTVGKTVRFHVVDVQPGSVLGFNVWAGEHLNFVSDEPQDIAKDNIVTARILGVETFLGSWVIDYQILSVEKGIDPIVGSWTFARAEYQGTTILGADKAYILHFFQDGTLHEDYHGEDDPAVWEAANGGYSIRYEDDGENYTAVINDDGTLTMIQGRYSYTFDKQSD